MPEEDSFMFHGCDFTGGLVPAVSGIDGIVLWSFDESDLKYKPEDVQVVEIEELGFLKSHDTSFLEPTMLQSKPSMLDIRNRAGSMSSSGMDIRAQPKSTKKKPLSERIPG